MLPVLVMGKSFREERGTGVGAEARQMPQKGGEKWGSDKGTLLPWAQDQHVLGVGGRQGPLQLRSPLQPLSWEGGGSEVALRVALRSQSLGLSEVHHLGAG